MRIIAKNRLYIIQQYANGKGDKLIRAEDALFDLLKNQNKVDAAIACDIWEDNIRYHNGKPFIIDFYAWIFKDFVCIPPQTGLD